MSAYAEIIDGFCVNVLEAEADFAAECGLTAIPDGYWIGDYYDGAEWYHGKPTTESQLLGQQITALHLSAIAQGQKQTDLELAMIEQGQYATQKELEAMQNV